MISEIYKLNMTIQEYHRVSFGKKNLKILGPKLWTNCRISLNPPESWNPSRETLSIGMENTAPARFVNVTNISFLCCNTCNNKAAVS